MLSYRHAFHAGNHADVLKHLILIQLCRHLSQKEAPFWVIDTHAGAGRYALNTGYATQLAEYTEGIGRLWNAKDLPPALQDYVEQVRQLNPSGNLCHYPGSPWIAHSLLRDVDRLRLFELHTSDVRLLNACFKDSGRHIQIAATDGFVGLKALLPPPSRRGLVLIDPSYEVRRDYALVPTALQDALKRFATGTYAIWHPLLGHAESHRLPDRLKALPATHWLHATLCVKRPGRDGLGMHGSGMFIINPPWTLEKTLKDLLPDLTQRLAQDEGARFTLDSQGH